MVKQFSMRRNPIYERCPSCSQPNTLHKSRSKNIKENIIKKFTFFKIYRCKNCGWRGYLSTYKFTAASIKTILLYGGLILIVVLIVRKVLEMVAR